MSALATRLRRAEPAPPGARRPPLRLAGRGASGRNPVHPGYFLDTRYLKPLRITQQALARDLGISRRRVNELIRGHRGITADTALRLAYYFRNEPAFWLQLQLGWDLHQAARKFKPLARRAASANPPSGE
jgi:addiction module HigA family antidote